MTDLLHKNSHPYRLLLVAGKSTTTDELVELLAAHGFFIKQATKFSDAIDTLFNFIPEIILLDSCGNELSALEFCTSVKSLNRLKGSVILLLSDRKDELMEISAFNAGADDFISYPIKLNALLERIKVRLKKPAQTITISLDRDNVSSLKIDRESYSVSMGNQFIQLSRKEFELLYLMASNPDKLFRRDEIFRLVWNKKSIGKNRTIDVHILRLRQKLGNRFIATQKGIGYRFVI